jgi:hypothetical protein
MGEGRERTKRREEDRQDDLEDVGASETERRDEQEGARGEKSAGRTPDGLNTSPADSRHL